MARRPFVPIRPVPIRDAIGIARVMCILGIVYVHAWTGLTAERIEALDDSFQGLLRWSLIELVGRSAVPLLGAISGWLAGPSAAKRSYPGFVRVKLRTVLAPMILWNLIALLLVSGPAWLFALPAPVPANLAEALDWTGCLTQPNPINVQIAFLRDLFLCLLAAPLLERMPDRVLWALWIAVAAWSVSGASFPPSLPLLLRPAILLFFLSGLLARRHALAERIAAWPLPLAALPYLLLVPAKIALSTRSEAWLKAHVAAAGLIDLPLRFAAALAVWRIALALAPTRAGRKILALEPHAFLLFCCHLVLIWLAGPWIGRLTGAMGSPFYVPFLLFQPLLALGGAMLVGRALEALSPRAARLLSGGRLARALPAGAP